MRNVRFHIVHKDGGHVYTVTCDDVSYFESRFGVFLMQFHNSVVYYPEGDMAGSKVEGDVFFPVYSVHAHWDTYPEVMKIEDVGGGYGKYATHTRVELSDGSAYCSCSLVPVAEWSVR